MQVCNHEKIFFFQIVFKKQIYLNIAVSLLMCDIRSVKRENKNLNNNLKFLIYLHQSLYN